MPYVQRDIDARLGRTVHTCTPILLSFGSPAFPVPSFVPRRPANSARRSLWYAYTRRIIVVYSARNARWKFLGQRSANDSFMIGFRFVGGILFFLRTIISRVNGPRVWGLGEEVDRRRAF